MGDLLGSSWPYQRPMHRTAVPIGPARVSVSVPERGGGEQQGAYGVVGYPQVISDFFDGPSGLRCQQIEETQSQTGHEHLKLREAETGDPRSKSGTGSLESLGK